MHLQSLLLFTSFAAAFPQILRSKAIVTSVAKARVSAIVTTIAKPREAISSVIKPATRASQPFTSVIVSSSRPVVQPVTSTAISSSMTTAKSSNLFASKASNVASTSRAAQAVPMTQLALPFTNEPAFVFAMLDTHNTYRQRHGVANLTWNIELVKAAVTQLAKQTFEHTTINRIYGENLATVYGNDWKYPATNSQNPRVQVQWWYDEVSLYDFSKPDFSHDTGHFTQVVWKDTQELGCAWDQLAGTDGGHTRRLTCEYSPMGNWLGEFAANVPRPVMPMPASQPWELASG